MNGPMTRQFEQWLANRNHSKYAITCHSGTQALEILAEYFKLDFSIHPPRVLIPSLTYVATANAFIRAGWDVHFVDTDPRGLLDFTKLPDVSFQAIVFVGLYGASIKASNLNKLWSKSGQTDTLIIEDAAQHWLSNDGHRTFSSAISFDPMKNLPCYGNGGAIVTDYLDLMDFAKSWKQNGSLNHQVVGTNSRMSEVDCALMLVKAEHLDQWQERRGKIARYWMERLKDTAINCLINETNVKGHAFHKFVIDLDHRDQLKAHLEKSKIETKIHYESPLHENSMFSLMPGPGMLSCASSLARRVLSLPIYPELTDGEVEYIIDQVLVHA